MWGSEGELPRGRKGGWALNMSEGTPASYFDEYILGIGDSVRWA